MVAKEAGLGRGSFSAGFTGLKSINRWEGAIAEKVSWWMTASCETLAKGLNGIDRSKKEMPLDCWTEVSVVRTSEESHCQVKRRDFQVC